MTRHLIAALALATGCASNPPAALHDTSAVAARMNDLSRAIVTADAAQLEAVAWPELTFGHANGRVETRAEFIGALAGRKSVIPKFELANVRTQHVGDLAIARGNLSGTYLSQGKPVDFQLGFVMLWQHRGGEWRLLAHQAHKL